MDIHIHAMAAQALPGKATRGATPPTCHGQGAQEAEARRLNRIVEAPATPWHEDDDYRKYDTPEPRMTWLGVIWGALVVFALWVRDVLARLTGRAG